MKFSRFVTTPTCLYRSRRSRTFRSLAAPALLFLGLLTPRCIEAQAPSSEQRKTNISSNVSLTSDNESHTFFTQTVTMPSSGCPCFLNVTGQLMVLATGVDLSTTGPTISVAYSDGTNTYDLGEHNGSINRPSTNAGGGNFESFRLIGYIDGNASYQNGQVIPLTVQYTVDSNGLNLGTLAFESADGVSPTSANGLSSFFIVSAGPKLPSPPTSVSFGTGTFQ